jgi:multicomponent Na+:H+ antiporter subunit B
MTEHDHDGEGDDGDGGDGAQVHWTEWDTPREEWLPADRDRPDRPRSLLLEVSTRFLFPTIVVFSVYLLFAGHNHAGGGFIGGLVAGLAFVLRFVAGGSMELAASLRLRPPTVIGMGISIAVVAALVPAAFGDPVLSSAVWAVHVPLLGDLKIASSLFLDTGVFLLIVGVVLDLLRSLGAGIEARELERRPGEEDRP